MSEDDEQPPIPQPASRPRKPRPAGPRSPRQPGATRGQRPAGKGGNRAAPEVPKLTPENLALLSGPERARSNLRKAMMTVIARQAPQDNLDAVKKLLGRFARDGRDLGQPLEVLRHPMLVYMDAVLCGRERMRADPRNTALASSWMAETVGRLVFGWKRQLERHFDAHPELKFTAAQAMGMPDDDDVD